VVVLTHYAARMTHSASSRPHSRPISSVHDRYPLSTAHPNPAHFEPLSLLPPDKFSPRKKQLLAKVVRHFRRFGEVVIKTFGGVFGSQSEKYDANRSESVGRGFWVHGYTVRRYCVCAARALNGLRGGGVCVIPFCRGSAVNTEGSNSLWLSRSWGHSPPIFSEVEASFSSHLPH